MLFWRSCRGTDDPLVYADHDAWVRRLRIRDRVGSLRSVTRCPTVATQYCRLKGSVARWVQTARGQSVKHSGEVTQEAAALADRKSDARHLRWQ
jgi:hypothetical protein